ncbi:MAG: M1 family metallopeptidase [Firmicutes bacterium]|nr:M1 family metallopeptidase [Bacillota bacterium]
MKKRVFLVALLGCALVLVLFLVGCNKTESVRTQYKIEATLIDETTLRANQRVVYTNQSELRLDKLVFNLYPNAYRQGAKYVPYEPKEATIADGAFGGISIDKVQVDGKSVAGEIAGVDKNILQVPVDLQPTKSATVSFDFEVKIPKINHRLGENGKTINFGNWYPIVGVLQNGEFRQDPYYSIGDPFLSETADYEVSIQIPYEYDLASTGAMSASSDGSTKLYKTKQSNVRDFAFVVSKQFESLYGEMDGTKIHYAFYDDQDAVGNLGLIKDTLKTFNEIFGKYPYDSITVVKTPFLHGGMEYPQVVFISDILEAKTYQEVIVHELAHQWWYAVVGNDQVNHAWIDEGLGEYATTVFFEKNPQYGVDSKRRLADVLSTFLLFCDLNGYINGKATVMEKPLNEFRSNMEYVFMVYAKGQLFFDCLRKSIGDKSFFEGLRSYYADNQFGLAQKVHLLVAFENASKRSLDSFFDSWILGKVQLLA